MKNKRETELRAALQGTRADESLRRRVVEYSREAALSGATVTSTALRLGMKPNTLHRWHQQAGRADGSTVGFVEVVGAVASESVEVVWPTGHVVRVGAGDLKTVFVALEAACCPRG
jgi:transposase-like protein